MRICIYGAGATGGFFAARLARTGEDVSVIARGAHLKAIAANGLTLKADGETDNQRVRAAENTAQLGPQDVVIVGVKATGLKPVADVIAPLLTPDTLVVFPQNGMPWWYPHGLPADRPAPPRLPNFDLSDAFFQVMAEAQVAGGLIYSANEVEAPGIVKNNSPGKNRIDIAPIGATTPALLGKLCQCLKAAGVDCGTPPDLRAAVWQKLLMNMSGSIIGLATGNKSSISREDPALHEVYVRVMREGLAISAAHGYPLDDRVDPETVLRGIPDHKASILQDYEQRRPMEIGEIVLAPQAFARAANVPTPSLDVLAAIVTRLARDRGLYPAP